MKCNSKHRKPKMMGGKMKKMGYMKGGKAVKDAMPKCKPN